MESVDLEKLISSDERLRVEFKAVAKREICKEIAAFATVGHGTVVVGVDDDGTIVGVENPKEEKERIANWIQEKVEPAPEIDIEQVSHGDSVVLVIRVKRREETFYMFDGKGYIRIDSSSHPLRHQQIVDLVRGMPVTNILSALEADVATAMTEATLAASSVAPFVYGQGELATLNLADLNEIIPKLASIEELRDQLNSVEAVALSANAEAIAAQIEARQANAELSDLRRALLVALAKADEK